MKLSKIINKLRINNEVSWNLTVQNWTVCISCTNPYKGIGWENQSTIRARSVYTFLLGNPGYYYFTLVNTMYGAFHMS